MMKENRLIGYTLDEINKQRLAAGATLIDPKLPVGSSPTSADANYTIQSAPTGQTAGAVLDPTGTAQTRYDETMQYWKDNPDALAAANASMLTNPNDPTSTDPNLLDIQSQSYQGMLDASKYSPDMTTATGNAEYLSDAQKTQDTIDNLSPKSGAMGQAGALGYNPKGILGNPTLQSLKAQAAKYSAPSVTFDPNSAAYLTTQQKNAMQDRYAAEKLTAEANLKAFQDKLKKEQENRDKITKQSAGQTPTTKTTEKGPDFSMFDAGMEQINAMLQADPHLAATYIPQMMDLMAKRNKLENTYNSDIGTFNNQDANNNGVADGVESSVNASRTAMITRSAKADAINIENRDINLAAANLAKDMSMIAQKKFELEQNRTEMLQVQNNIEMQRKNRLIANKLGIAQGGNGMRWMSEEIQKGVDNLTFLRESGSLQEASFALQIGSQYAINVRQATNGYDSQKLQIDSEFASNMANLNSIVTLDAKERRAERKSITKDYLEALDKNDTKFSDQVKDFNKALAEQIKESAKAKKDAVIKTKDTLAFTSDLRKEMEGNDVVKLAEKVSTSFSAFKAVYRQSQIESEQLKLDPNSTTRLGSDQSLITMFNKLTDPASVVRESEYNRTPDGGNLYDKYKGMLDRLISSGGAGLTQKGREELMQTAQAIDDAYNKVLQDTVTPYFNDIVTFNSQDGLESKVDYKSFPALRYAQVPDAIKSKWSEDMGRADIPDNLPSTDPNSYDTSSKLEDDGLRSILQAAGFSGRGLEIAYAVAKAESGGRPKAYNGNESTGDNSYGIFQINMLGDMGKTRRDRWGLYSNEQLYDPLRNAQIAYDISNGGKNWRPWGSFTNGSYRNYLASGQDKKEVAQTTPISSSQYVQSTTAPRQGGVILSNSPTTGGGETYNVKKYLNRITGQVVNVPHSDEKYYVSRPEIFEDMSKPPPVQKSISLSLGGKPLPI